MGIYTQKFEALKGISQLCFVAEQLCNTLSSLETTTHADMSMSCGVRQGPAACTANDSQGQIQVQHLTMRKRKSGADC